MCAQLHFHDDVQESPLELFHKLKLYADADPTNQGTKKPVRSDTILCEEDCCSLKTPVPAKASLFTARRLFSGGRRPCQGAE